MSTISSRATIFVIGDVTAPSFQAIHQHLLNDGLVSAVSLSGALELVESAASSPDMVVVWQSVPDEYPRSQAEQLIGRLPLARWVVVFGPWCESMGRTEQVWPTAWTVPLRHAETRIELELRELECGSSPLPATMSRDETFATLFRSDTLPQKNGPASTARVSGDDPQFCDLLHDALADFGVEVSDSHDAELQLLHVTVPDNHTCDRIRALRRQSSESRIAVITDLAPSHTEQSLLKAGADVVLTQLRFASEFAAWL